MTRRCVCGTCLTMGTKLPRWRKVDLDATSTQTGSSIWALVRLLEIVGEVASRMTPEECALYPDIPWPQQFAGALQAQKASKGIFITTSRFTDDARGYVTKIGSKIVLIDGEQLTQLMIEHDVGVSTVSLYPVKKIDTDYFDEGI
jgi:hypothetical protein